MKNLFTGLMACMMGVAAICASCNNDDDIVPHKDNAITIKGYTVSVENKDSSFSSDTRQWMTNVFFMVYPKLAERFNFNTPKRVTFVIDPAFREKNAVSKDSVIIFNANWLTKNPNDIDLVTRQLMLIVGGYNRDKAPDWIIQGMADYARYIFGVDNKEAGWRLPEVSPDQKVDQSGKVTARFLVWLEKRVAPEIVDELNDALIQGTFKDKFWEEATGRNISTLWELYQKSPSITTSFPPAIFAQAANKAQTALMEEFWNPKEHFFITNNHGNQGYNYWWNAHGLDVLVDGYLRTEQETYKEEIELIYQGIFQKNGSSFFNDFNDDMEWMALACLRAYDATHANQYLFTAEDLWNKIIESWSDFAGGGITWKRSDPFGKNSCANGPASILAARLYKQSLNEQYLDWAKKIFEWEKQTLVDPQTGVVWDNIHSADEGELEIQKWTFTYNQGTYIGAALALFDITGDSAYLKEAIKTTNFTISDDSFVNGDGVLKENGQGDGGLFKGIFVRYLNNLILSGHLKPAVQKKYIDFMKTNGYSLLNKGSFQKEDGLLLNSDWTNAPDNGYTDASSQISGVMLFEALAELQRNGLIK